jgi:hypothetical protein
MSDVFALDIDHLRVNFRPEKYRTRSDRLVGFAYLLIALVCLAFLVLVGVMSLAMS